MKVSTAKCLFYGQNPVRDREDDKDLFNKATVKIPICSEKCSGGTRGESDKTRFVESEGRLD